MKEFDLNIGKILEDWEIYHAIREIIANALDEQLLTNTAKIAIVKTDNVWCIRDFGRGLNYHHLTQNENPEKTDNDKVIGRFGVGLKDALATLFRHNIKVEIQSKYGVITLKESTKNTFDDIVTLHAQIAPPTDDQMLGTAFYICNCPDYEIDKAKHMFLHFSTERIIETTSYGQVIAKVTDIANIYINGVKVAEEPNFAFSYNITALSKQIKKALNRERTNVGRTAYADRIKSILLEATDKEVVRTLSNNLESMSNGAQCDEIKWVDVAAHVVQTLNVSDDTVFVTPNEIASSSGRTNEILQNSGKRIVFVPESVKKKAEQESDGEISTISTVVQDYYESYSYSFVNVENLTELEKANWNKIPTLLEKLGLSLWFKKCFISEKLKDTDDNTVGVWDSFEQKIIILRSQLWDTTNLFGTVLHEIIHASTGATDVSRFFETKLSEMIGRVSSIYISEIENNNQSNNVQYDMVIENAKDEYPTEDISLDYFDFSAEENTGLSETKESPFGKTRYCKEHCEFYSKCMGNCETCVKDTFKKAFETLMPREEKIICLSFGIERKQHSLEEIAKEIFPILYDSDRTYYMQRVRQLQSKALRKLRHPRCAKTLHKGSMGVVLFASPEETSYSKLWSAIFGESNRAALYEEFTVLAANEKAREEAKKLLEKEKAEWQEKKQESQARITISTTVTNCYFGNKFEGGTLEAEITVEKLIQLDGVSLFKECGYNKTTFEEIVLVLGSHDLYFCDCNENYRSNLSSYMQKIYNDCADKVSLKTLEMTIEELDFSVRTYNCLKRAGIYTVRDLTERTYEQMVKVRNLGEKSLEEEVIQKLASLGLSLKADEE